MESAQPAATPPSGLPLFYQAPEPLSSEMHGNWRLRPGDYAFAASTPYVPVVASEFAAASRHYPLVFSAGDSAPVAVLGLERRNLFVENGHWAEDAYVPAYVRRYPFAFMATPDPDEFVLAIDAATSRLSRDGGEGEALFAQGEPSPLTRQALGFCDAFRQEAAHTHEIVQALAAKDLLVERRADATLPDGRTFGLTGFRIIDEQRFAELDSGTLRDWHGKGWLALVYFHIASLERFSVLLARQGHLATVAGEAPALDR